MDIIIETDLLSGTGITKVSVPESEVKDTGFIVEMRKPFVKPSNGCGKALLLSYWCGAVERGQRLSPRAFGPMKR